MVRRPRLVWLTAGAAAALAGVVAAQPVPPAPPAPQNPPVAAAPPSPAEAPPPTIVTPSPVPAAPPVNATPPAPAPPPAKETPQEAAAPKAPETPARRPRFDIAVLQALDKVTAETLRFEAPVGRPVRYKTLIFTVRACERTTPDEPIEDSIAYVEILSQPKADPGHPVLPAKQAFKGWMYASSPGLNPLEHPVYDAWLISCRAASPAPAPPGVTAPTR